MNPSIYHQVYQLAVLAAAVAYFALGVLWYSKVLFANRWLALTKIDASDPNSAHVIAGIMTTSFITILVAGVGSWYPGGLSCFVRICTRLKPGTFTGTCFGIKAISNIQL